MMEVQDARTVKKVLPGRRRAVTEEDAGVAVLVVDDGAHHVATDHQDFAVGAGAGELRSYREGVEKAGAGGGKGRSPRRAWRLFIWIRQEVDGNIMSGVTVAVTMRSISSGEVPVCLRTSFAAIAARSEVATPFSAMVAFGNAG